MFWNDTFSLQICSCKTHHLTVSFSIFSKNYSICSGENFKLSLLLLIEKKNIFAELSRNATSRAIAESPTTASMQNKHNRDQQYLAVRIGRGQQPLAVEDTYKAESSDYIEDICPYATFQLSKPAYSESSYSGNVYSGPYHSVRGSFFYHDVKPPPIDKFRLGHVSLFFVIASSSVSLTLHLCT